MGYFYDIDGSTELEELRIWARFERKLKKFRNNSTLATFNEIFEKDGERLRIIFFELEGNIHKFETYLTTEQRNKFLSYVAMHYKAD